MPLLHAAHRYSSPVLWERCIKYAKENLTLENVCTILEQSAAVEGGGIERECLDFISKETSKVLKTPGFLSLSKDMLSGILAMHCLNVEGEEEIYIACRNWAVEACKVVSEESASDDRELRKMLEGCLSLIRFPTMTYDTFVRIVANENILTDSEKVIVMRSIASGEWISQFLNQKRLKPS